MVGVTSREGKVSVPGVGAAPEGSGDPGGVPRVVPDTPRARRGCSPPGTDSRPEVTWWRGGGPGGHRDVGGDSDVTAGAEGHEGKENSR